VQAAVRRQTAPVPHQMDARQRYQRCQLLQQFERREFNASYPVRPRFCKRVDEVPISLVSLAVIHPSAMLLCPPTKQSY
jgi:hypothetical protein